MKVKRYEIALGPRVYPVVVPDCSELDDLFVIMTEAKSAVIFANEACLCVISSLVRYMETSNATILFVNVKRNALTDYLRASWSSQTHSKDLVLVHHSMQLRVHEWKQIRNLIRKSAYKEAAVDVNEPEDDVGRNLGRFRYTDHKDYLDVAEHSDTIFMTGSSEVFRELSRDAWQLSKSGREAYLSYPGAHDHEHIDYYARRVYTKNHRYDGWFLCLDYYDRELWESAGQ